MIDIVEIPVHHRLFPSVPRCLHCNAPLIHVPIYTMGGLGGLPKNCWGYWTCSYCDRAYTMRNNKLVELEDQAG